MYTFSPHLLTSKNPNVNTTNQKVSYTDLLDWLHVWISKTLVHCCDEVGHQKCEDKQLTSTSIGIQCFLHFWVILVSV